MHLLLAHCWSVAVQAECLKRMAAVVAARKSEWEQRPAAVQALAQAIITVRALSSEPETSPRQTVTSPIKRQADEAEAWMRTEIAVQVSPTRR